MLVFPVRLDAGHGALWGAAIWCAVAMAVCVEAAWAVRGAAGAIAVGGFAVVLAATQPDVLVNPVWDPHFGLVWFAATCMAAWAVGTGRLQWWLALVLAASIAAQAHLVYALPAALLAIVAPVAGLRARAGVRRSVGVRARAGLDRRAVARRGEDAVEGWTWAVLGLVVGALCWAVPIAQQLTGHPGNVTVLLRCVGNRQVMGGRFGLETLASAVVPPPLWFHSPSGDFHSLMGALRAHSAADGIAVLVMLGVVGVVAWTLRHRDLAVLAGVALLVAGATALEMGHQPTSARVSVLVADVILWPVGMLVWGVAALTVAEAVTRWGGLARRHSVSDEAAVPRRQDSVRRSISPRSGRALLWGVTAVVLVGGSVNAVLVASGAMSRSAREDGGRGAFRGAAEAAVAAERLVPRGPFVIGVSGYDASASLNLLDGTLWVLISQGRDVTLAGVFAEAVTPPVHSVPGEPLVAVTVREDGSVSKAVLMLAPVPAAGS